MTFRQLVRRYLSHLDVERGLSPNTLSAYRTDLAYVGRRVGSADLGAISVERWREHLSAIMREDFAEGITASTAARRISSFRGFFGFLIREQVIDVDPTSFFDPPQIQKRVPRVLSVRQVERLVAATPAGPLGQTHRAMLIVLFAAGLRVSELCCLRVEDADLASRALRVMRGKGGQPRIAPLGPVGKAALAEYLRDVRPRFASADQPWLFVSSKRSRFTRAAVWKIVNRCARLAGVKASPHTMRHSFATALLRGGANLREVQAMLGHASMATTALYTHVDVRDLSMALARAHPRGMRIT